MLDSRKASISGQTHWSRGSVFKGTRNEFTIFGSLLLGIRRKQLGRFQEVSCLGASFYRSLIHICWNSGNLTLCALPKLASERLSQSQKSNIFLCSKRQRYSTCAWHLGAVGSTWHVSNHIHAFCRQTSLTHLRRKRMFSVCRSRPVFIMIAWKTFRSSTHILQSLSATRRKKENNPELFVMFNGNAIITRDWMTSPSSLTVLRIYTTSANVQLHYVLIASHNCTYLSPKQFLCSCTELPALRMLFRNAWFPKLWSLSTLPCHHLWWDRSKSGEMQNGTMHTFENCWCPCVSARANVPADT